MRQIIGYALLGVAFWAYQIFMSVAAKSKINRRYHLLSVVGGFFGAVVSFIYFYGFFFGFFSGLGEGAASRAPTFATFACFAVSGIFAAVAAGRTPDENPDVQDNITGEQDDAFEAAIAARMRGP